MAEIKAFIDVENKALTDNTGKIAGVSMLDNVGAINIGAGNKVMRADESGLWLGANRWADAPFRVDMNGNVVATSADFSGAGYTKINIYKQATIPVSVSIGDLWFDTDDGNKLYRAGSAGADAIATGEWELMATSTISVFAQNGIPTSLAVGDLWYDTNDSNKVYRASSIGADAITAGEWEIVNDLRAADALLKAGTSQTLSGDFLVGGSGVKIDGVNTRILINDGTNNRIVIGNV